MEDDDKEEKIVMEEPGDLEDENKNTSDIKCCLKILSILLILALISTGIFFLLRTTTSKEGEKELVDEWTNSYKKAKEFINKLNLTEKISLLYGTENYPYSPIYEERRKMCVGRLDPFNNSKIEFKGMCL